MIGDLINLGLEKDKVVIFADMLGFSEKIKNMDLYQENINNSISGNKKTDGCIDDLDSLYNIITQKDNSKEIQESNGYTFRWISDSIILTSKYDNIGLILDKISNLSNTIITLGMIIRGGISCGNLHDSDNIIGVPYIEAVELEKMANYPRILIHKDKYIKIKTHLCGEYEFMKEYFKPTEMDNYLEFDFIEYSICGGTSKVFSELALATYVDFFVKQMDDIIKKEKDIKIIEKYAWLGKKLLSIIDNYKDDYDKKENEICEFKYSKQMIDEIKKYKIIDIV